MEPKEGEAMTRAEIKAKTACFTGHRDIRPQDRPGLKETLKEILVDLIKEGYRYFGAGGARGFDNFASQCVLELRDIYPHIALIMVLPFAEQYRHERGWYREDVELYHDLQRRAQKVRILEPGYSTGVYYRRNVHLVAFSSVCISYQYKDTGGTAYTVREAQARGLKIINCI